MSNLLEVKNLIGVTDATSDDIISTALVAGGRIIAERLPVDKLKQFSTESASSTQHDLTNKKLIEINSATYFIPVTSYKFNNANTAGSLYQVISGGSQCYTFEGDKLKLSAASPVIVYEYPTLVSGDLSNLPSEYVYGAVLYSASNSLITILKNEAYTLLTYDDLNVPKPSSTNLSIAINAIVYTAATATDAAAVSVGAFTEVGMPETYDAFITKVNNFVATASDASTSVVDIAEIQLPSSTPASTVDSASSVDVAVSGVISDIQDLSANNTGIVSTVDSTAAGYFPSKATISAASDIGSADMQQANALLADITTTITELNDYFTKLDNSSTGLIDVQEDVELAQIKINEMNVKLEEVKTELGTSLQQALKNIEEKNQVAIQNMVQKNNLILQNKIRKEEVALQIGIQENQVNLKNNENKVQIDLQNAIQQNNKLMQSLMTVNNFIIKTAELKNSIKAQNAANELQRTLQNAVQANTRLLKNAESATTVNLQNAVQATNAALKNAEQNNSVLLQNAANTLNVNLQNKVQANQVAIQNSVQKNNALLNYTEKQIGVEMQNKVQENNRLLQIASQANQVAIQNASQKVNLDLQNAGQNLVMLTTRAKTYAEKYMADISLYQNYLTHQSLHLKQLDTRIQQLSIVQKSLTEQFMAFMQMMFPQAAPQQGAPQ